jgi:hypothetical protein
LAVLVRTAIQVGVIMIPLSAWAQEGVYVWPRLGLSETYDDNVFSTPSTAQTPSGAQIKKVDDFIFRAEPGVAAGYSSTPFSLLADYWLGADVYAKHSDLTEAPARQFALLKAQYWLLRTLSLSFNGGYAETHLPSELNAPTEAGAIGLSATGLEIARARTRIYHLGPSVAWLIDPLTQSLTSYDFTQVHVEGSGTTDYHSVKESVQRKLTALDTGDINYTYRRYSINDLPFTAALQRSVSDSHAITIGWGREITPRIHILLRGGPRITDGSVSPEALGAISYRFIPQGEATFQYERTQTLAIGVSGPVNVESFRAWVDYRLMEHWVIGPELALYRDRQEDLGADADVYVARLWTRYQFLKHAWVFGLYEYIYQNQQLGFGAHNTTGGDIHHNIVQVGLTLTAAERVY